MNKKGSIFNKVMNYIGGYSKQIILALSMAIASSLIMIFGPQKIGEITDLISEGLSSSIDMHEIKNIAVTLICIYLAGGLLNYGQHCLMSMTTLKISYKFRKDLERKINSLPFAYFNQTSQGDILSTITNDISSLQQSLSNSLTNIVCGVIQFTGCLLMLLFIEYRLGLLALLITAFGLSVLVAITAHSQKYFKEKQACLGNISGYIEEMYSGHQVIRTSRAENNVFSHFDQINEGLYTVNWKSQFFSGLTQPLMAAVGNIDYVAICLVGAMLAFQGKITIGVIVSSIMYVKLISSPLGQIAQGVTIMQSGFAAAGRIFELLEAEELPDESGKLVSLPEVKGDVRFENVRFAYPDSLNQTVIKDFSAEVSNGQQVAIVGPTGAGKTTLVNLLMKFYEPQSGNIYIDSTPTRDLSRAAVHSCFSMVLQDTWIFNGTLRENLVYNLENISEKQLDEVCRICGLKHFVSMLPEGYDTILNETSQISAGQKQLITIARAMLQNNPMLILDEATSSIDTRTEKLLQRAMNELISGRTSFIIAHRLSTIRNADQILVIKDGDIVETGTHDSLMEKNGFYAELYNSQFPDTATA